MLGLWGYNGDTVQFTSLKPYRIIVSGRIKHYTAFGEHVIGKSESALQKQLLELLFRLMNLRWHKSTSTRIAVSWMVYRVWSQTRRTAYYYGSAGQCHANKHVLWWFDCGKVAKNEVVTKVVKNGFKDMSMVGGQRSNSKLRWWKYN
jgi:hypothetical protein